MDDTLLFLHVLSAFLIVAAVAIQSAVALGAPLPSRGMSLSDLLVSVGGTGTLLFGIWIVLRNDAYGIGDGWIVGAIVLWVVATGVGVRAGKELRPAVDGQAITQRALSLHVLQTLLLIGFLVLMIWKPGA